MRALEVEGGKMKGHNYGLCRKCGKVHKPNRPKKKGNLLVTGASGFLGTVLVDRLLERGHRVYALSRHPPAHAKNLIPLIGDVTKSHLGLEQVPDDIHAVHHLAAIHRLGEDKDGSIWDTNVHGTENVINFCLEHNIKHLFFISTAYTQGRNTYERSKALCELMLKESDIPKVTILKPSIVMGTAEHPYPGHFSQFVSVMVQMLRKAGLLKESVEGALGLPILEFVLRIKGNPEGKLNLVTVDVVAEAMANIEREGTFWLTNPDPPTLGDIVKWVGEFIAFDFRILSDFKPRPFEAQLMKRVAAFEPYLEGDDFPSDLKECVIDRAFVHDIIKRTIFA